MELFSPPVSLPGLVDFSCRQVALTLRLYSFPRAFALRKQGAGFHKGLCSPGPSGIKAGEFVPAICAIVMSMLPAHSPANPKPCALWILNHFKTLT